MRWQNGRLCLENDDAPVATDMSIAAATDSLTKNEHQAVVEALSDRLRKRKLSCIFSGSSAAATMISGHRIDVVKRSVGDRSLDWMSVSADGNKESSGKVMAALRAAAYRWRLGWGSGGGGAAKVAVWRRHHHSTDASDDWTQAILGLNTKSSNKKNDFVLFFEGEIGGPGALGSSCIENTTADLFRRSCRALALLRSSLQTVFCSGRVLRSYCPPPKAIGGRASLIRLDDNI